MKIKLDENLAAHGKAMLEAAGHDVMTVNEQKLSGATDNRVTRSAATKAGCSSHSTMILAILSGSRPK